MAEYRNTPAIGAREAGKNIDECGLASAIRAEQTEKLAAPDIEADAIQRAHLAELLVQVVYRDRRSHAVPVA
jgi:hypothetical protein